MLGGLGALVVGGAVAVASVALAAPSQPPSPSPSVSVSAGVHPGPRGGMRGPAGPLAFGPGRVLHGEYVVPKPGGGYQTVDVQDGAVTAVSSTSITVKSDDGFSKTYTVSDKSLVTADRDGIAAVKVGDRVSVQATVNGGTATITAIRDLSQIQAAHPKKS
jgi:hypothetical protein